MSLRKRIVTNTAILGMTNGTVLGVSFLVSVLIARNLGAEDFGKYSLAIAFSMIAFRLSELGLETILKRDLARHRLLTDQLLSNALFIRFISVLIVFILNMSVVKMLRYPHDTSYVIYLTSLSYAMSSISLIFVSIYHAYELMYLESIGRIASNLLKLCIVFTLLSFHCTLLTLIAVFLIPTVIELFIYICITRYRFAPSICKPTASVSVALLKESYPLAFAGFFVMLYYRADTVLLSILSTDKSVGIYNAAYSFLAGLTIIPGAFHAALFPNLSRYFLESKEQVRRLFLRSILFTGLIGGVIAAVAAVFSQHIITFVYGSKYSDAATTMQILMLASLFLFMNNTAGTTLNAINKQHVNMLIVGFAACLNIVLNVVLIPYYDYNGAAFATLATEAMVLLLCLLCLRKALWC